MVTAVNIITLVILAAAAGGILGVLIDRAWLENRHDCMPHNPDKCEGLHTAGTGHPMNAATENRVITP